MAIIKAPFTITGTLDNLNFYIDQDNVNRVRTKGKSGISSKEFHSNPIYNRIKQHNKEFGSAVKTSRIFRALASSFNSRAKDGSFAGRANKLLFEILEEDTQNPLGERSVACGLDTAAGAQLLVGFEGKKVKPLYQTLQKKGYWNDSSASFNLPQLSLLNDIQWPEQAAYVHFAVALSHWDYKLETYNTTYSEEVILEKKEQTLDLCLKPTALQADKLVLLFVFLSFSENYKNKIRPLKRSFNSVTIQQVLKHSITTNVAQ